MTLVECETGAPGQAQEVIEKYVYQPVRMYHGAWCRKSTSHAFGLHVLRKYLLSWLFAIDL